MLQVRTVGTHGGIFYWRTVTAPEFDGLDPDRCCFRDCDRNTVCNVASFADFNAGAIAEGDSLFSRLECLYMSPAVGSIISHPSFAGFSVRLSPSSLSDCHLISPKRCDMNATWGNFIAETCRMQALL